MSVALRRTTALQRLRPLSPSHSHRRSSGIPSTSSNVLRREVPEKATNRPILLFTDDSSLFCDSSQRGRHMSGVIMGLGMITLRWLTVGLGNVCQRICKRYCVMTCYDLCGGDVISYLFNSPKSVLGEFFLYSCTPSFLFGTGGKHFPDVFFCERNPDQLCVDLKCVEL